jgi:hypothetical protein
MQALACLLPTDFSSGTTFAHSDIAIGHLVRNTHPDGGLIGLGISPFNIIRLRRLPGVCTGTADSSALVYGWLAFS